MLFGQRIALSSFFVDFIAHLALLDDGFLAGVSTVRVKQLAPILVFEQRFQLLGIVVAGWCYHPVVDEFGALIDLDCGFVAVKAYYFIL